MILLVCVVLLLPIVAECNPQVPPNINVQFFFPQNATTNQNKTNNTYGFKVPNQAPPPYPTNGVNNAHFNVPNNNLPGSYIPLHNQPANYPASNPAYYANKPVSNLNGNGAGTRTLTMGQREFGDSSVLKTVVIKKPKWYRSTVLTKDITFPDSKMKLDKITSIVVTDNTKNGSGGHTKVLSGGVGYPKVSLQFESTPNNAIDLGLVIYGFKK